MQRKQLIVLVTLLAVAMGFAPLGSRFQGALSIMRSHTRVQAIEGINRADFPILSTEIYPSKALIYLDSAASSQRPNVVIDAMSDYYRTSHANVHRGAHALAVKATTLYEEARVSVQDFIHAKMREEIIFTRGATEAINLVAQSWGQRLQPGDEIILSVMEHHSNLVPWQMLAQRTGAVIKFVEMKDMVFDMESFDALLSNKTRLVAIAHASNVLGYINPVEEIIRKSHSAGALVLLDACQSVPHMPVNVQALDVDFLVASSHKMCGPTGIGFLYGKHEHLLSMPPVQGGGEMIDKVDLQGSTYALPPSRFEPGTPAIAEAVGLGSSKFLYISFPSFFSPICSSTLLFSCTGAACRYLATIGMERIHQHETSLGEYLYDQLNAVEGLVLYGPPPNSMLCGAAIERTGLVAFTCKGVHATDLSFFLDQEGVAVRTGHHCTQPLHAKLGIAGSLRASLYFYNSQVDVDVFVEKLREVMKMFDSLPK